ncbi:abnormal spindle-like microcephaly-associated protein homolog [Mizuhopecten yessoensis]|uniref:Abnormal spindle-like microcephaly-associated protein-like n=1 Tax=Mizuhopecten yessoensis TaxID=6573 RepID=A0A210QLT1_MIZYE|nr:abnormal spindle-like microcephaly-associated protein homolog [Mizuhopecten yessoensis]OWF49690.1 Abnormal spindle-like microcephaly-associated protein-like [Mizuhopecten yessoensis]
MDISDYTGTFSPSQEVAMENFGSIAFTTSTPSNPTRRSGRKSWFDNLGNPGKGTKYEIAIEKKVKRRSAGRRKSEEGDIETLTLTHFTNPPRIGFGRAKPGMIKRRSLIIKNPHDHPQDVKVEKFPFKKHFDIDKTKFTVEAEDTLLLTITWSPEEEGNFREMILLQVDGSYRLQAFVFGCVEKPPQKKKVKKGILGRAMKKPFSIIQTPSLANIAKSYSPTKGETRRSGEGQKRLSKGRENKVPAPMKKTPARHQDSFPPKQKESLVIPNQVVGGCIDSEFPIGHITPIKPLEDSIKSAEFVVPKVVKMPGKSSVKKLQGKDQEELECLSPLVAKYLDNSDDDIIVVRQTINNEDRAKLNTPDRIILADLNTPDRILSTNQDTPDTITNMPGSEPQNSDLNTPVGADQVSEKTPDKENQWFDPELKADALSPNSFLQDSLCSQRGIDTSLYDVGSTISRLPAHSTLLPTPERMSRPDQPMKNFISPNKFLKELNDTQERLELSFQHDPNTIPSPESILNSSIPHDIMVKQLQTVKMSLATQNPSPLFSPMSFDNKRETFVLKSALTAYQSPMLRRETFIRERTAITPKDVSRPRRTTFTRQGNQKAITKKEDIKSKGADTSISRKEARKGNKENLCKKPICAIKKFKQDRISEDSLDGSISRSPIPTHISSTNSLHQKALNTPELLVNINTKALTKSTCVKTQEREISTAKRLFVPCGEVSPTCNSPSSVFGSPNLTVDTPTVELLPCKEHGINTGEEPSNTGKGKHDRMSQDSLDGLISVINTTTVTKEKPVNDITPEGRTSTGKRLFTQESGVSPTQDASFQSPSVLPADTPMRELFARRATLTVTKERPSDTLLQVTQKNLSSHLNTEDTAVACDIKVHNLSNDSPRLLTVVPEENPERCVSILLKNSPNLHSMGLTPTDVSVNSTSSFTKTPHQLPTSPNPDNSRRSTHVVENPKVLDLSIVGRKRLFPPLEDPDDEAAIQTDNLTTKMGVASQSTNRVNPITIDHPNKVTVDIKSITQQTNEEKSLGANDPISINDISIESKPVESCEPKTGREQQLKGDNASDSPATDKAVTVPEERKPYVAFITGSPDPVIPAAKKSVMANRGKEMVKKRTHSETRGVSETSNKRLRSTGSIQTGVLGMTVPTLSRPTTKLRQAMATKDDTKTSVPQKPSNRTKCAGKGLAQTKLILMKRTRPTALPKHPMPFASKNMYYDERWIDKQERGFVHWLNFVLTPADEYQHNNKRVKVDAGALCVEASRSNIKLAPSKEVLSIRAYTARRRLNQLRRSSCNLFQTKEIVHVIQKLEAEIESLRLVIRKDKKVHADLGMKQNILDMILSFNPLWLRIGLETVYGEMIPIQNNSDVIGISRFIVTRLLSNPDIASEYCHPTVPHLYRDGYAEAIAQHLMKKFFMLIFFLDQAKSNRLINHDPCLFCKDSEFKSTKAMLIQFSRNYLSGEGDVTKHLGYLGYVVTHQQTSMDEFDYAVTNLATDLRDGIRLTRILELLTNHWDLSKKLRTPAISRLQKVHNMEVVFKALTTQGVTFDNEKKITPKDLCDGHREKTLHVLWGLILQYQVDVLLNEEQLREEIDILQRSLRVRNQLEALHRYEQGLSKKRRESAEQDLHMQNDRLLLLLRWCRTVCAFYHIKIENFTVSFGDGRAMCALVHHYHPSLLPWESIHTKTTLTYQDDLEEEMCNSNLELNSSDVFSPAPFPVAEDPVLFEELLLNEKSNFKLLYEKVSELGGIPLMLRSMDMSNTIPDEKVVVTYICYLCARLLDIRHESRAARVIQLAWRRHYLRRSKKELQVKHDAAIVIQTAARRFLRAKQAVRRAEGARVLQKYVRAWLARRTAAQLKAADEERRQTTAACVLQTAIRKWLEKQMTTRQTASIRIQTTWRCHRQMESYRRIKSACITLQKHTRMYLQKSRYVKVRHAVVCIQRRYRAHHSRMIQRNEYLTVRSAAVTLQSRYRGLVQRQKFLRCRASAVVIQASVKMWINRQKYQSIRLATVTIQRFYRANQTAAVVRQEFLLQKQSAITIQACFKSHMVRKNIRHCHTAAVIIQSQFKGFLEHKRYLTVKSAAIKVQRWKRAMTQGRLARSEFIKVKSSVVKIQSVYRGYRTRSDFLKQRSAAITIQANVRGHQKMTAYRKLKDAVLTLQRRFRASREGEKVRRHFMVQKGAAMTIQAFYRGHKVRQEIKHLHSSATKIEATVKGHLQRKKFLGLKKSALVIQRKLKANLEGDRIRKEFLVKKGAAMTIQAHFRGLIVRRNISHLHASAVIIQSQFKGFLEHKRYLTVKSAVVKIQRWKKAIAQGRLARSEFKKVKLSVVKIQSAYRGHRKRSDFLKQRSAVISIQAHVRGHQKMTAYRKLKDAVLILQRRFRASREGEKVRRHFMVQKGAAMTIQAFYRGHKVRQEIKHLHSAATKIEATVKGHLQREKFLRLKKSALVIQRKLKANLEGDRIRKEFLVKKGAAMTIQAHFRGLIVRRNISHLHASAVIIQSQFKGFLEHMRYLTVKSAVVKIQRWKRAITQGRLARSDFKKVKSSVVKIQSAYRGHRTRSDFLKQRSAAIAIQAHVRGHQKMTAYRKLKDAVLTLQRRFRASREGEKVRRHFMVQKGAAMTIQAFYRGHKVRQEIKHLHSAATKIEATVKGHLQRKKFLRLRNSALIIQGKFKANMEGNRVRKEFLVKKGAAMTIQAYFRGHKVRQGVARMHLAANVIQSKFQGYLQRKRFLRVKSAAIIIQQIFIAHLAGKRLRKEFLARKGAAMTVQAAFRGYTVRKAMVRYNRAAVIVQSFYRAHRAAVIYKKHRTASICIQKWYKNLLFAQRIKADYLSMRVAAVTIQAWYRCHRAVKVLRMDKSCVITSQAVVKGFLQRRRYLRLRHATVVIQRRLVARRECINVRRAFLIRKGAAIAIQAVFRGYLVRHELQRQHVAAVVIQSMYKTHRAVLSYNKQRQAVAAIQSWYRNCLYTRTVRSDYLTKKQAVVVIQKHYQTCLTRRAYLRDLSNIILIQALVRGTLRRIAYRRLQWAVITCQTRYRAMLACHQQQCRFHNLRSAAIVLQSAWRQRTVQAKYNKTRQAAILLQSHFRMIPERKRYCQLKSAAIRCQRLVQTKRQMQECRRDYLITLGAVITIQAHIRSFLVRKQYHTTCKSVICVQACVRRFLAQRQYRKTYNTVVVVQKHLRACLATKIQRSLFLAKRQAVLVIQTAFRRVQARKYVRKVRAAIVIQKTFRMHVARQDFVRRRNAAIVLQSHHRAFLARQEKTCRKLALVSLQRAIKMFLFRRKLLHWIHTRNEAATRIQSCFRGYIARLCVRKTKSAIVLQSMYRMHAQRRWYLCIINSVILLQSGLRGALARRRVKHIHTQHRAATCIQTAYRAYKRRQEEQESRRKRMAYLEKFSGVVSSHLSVIKIQRCYRNHRVLLAARQRLTSIIVLQRWMRAKLARMQFLRFISAVKVVQTRARKHLHFRNAAVIKLQAVVRGWLGRRSVIHQEQSAITLQAIWRGRRVRKTYPSKKLENIRKNLKEATKIATEDRKLGNRTESALDYLLKYKQLSQILEALIHLETSTRLSPACCQRMVNVNAVGVIYRLIQSCNRSQPHMEIIRYSINILLNLAKYERTRAAVYEVDGATECLLELMQVYREKGHIFSCSCTLMGILGMMEDKRQVILNDKKVTSKLLSIYTLTARKHKITEARLIRQAKISAAKSFNATLPILPSQRRQHRIHPDWVLQRNKMRHIEDPLQAIKFVLDNFQLTPK